MTSRSGAPYSSALVSVSATSPLPATLWTGGAGTLQSHTMHRMTRPGAALSSSSRALLRVTAVSYSSTGRPVMLTRFLRWALPLKRHNPKHRKALPQPPRLCRRHAGTAQDGAGTCRTLMPGQEQAPYAPLTLSLSHRRHWSTRCRTHHSRRTILCDGKTDWFTGYRGHD